MLTFPATTYIRLPHRIARRLHFIFDLAVSVTLLCVGRFMPSLRQQLPSSQNHLSGKTAIVTGANSGIGLQIALDLAQLGARIVLACRNTRKGEDALQQILSAVPSAQGRIEVCKLDTSSLWSVKESAILWQRQSASQRQIDILVHNAGIAGIPENSPSNFSDDGYELTYATNFLGSFLLTHLLEDCLSETARVIFTSSTGQYSGRISSTFSLSSVKNEIEPGFHTIPLRRVPAAGKLASSSSRYSMTKSMQCAFARSLQARWDRISKQTGATNRRVAHSFTPGFTSTPIFSKFDAKSLWTEPLYAILKATTWLATDVSEGAATGVWLASTNDSEVVGVEHGGRYWDRCTSKMCTADLLSTEVSDRLWRRWEVDAGIEWR